jgi:hypothetical protein
MNRFIVFFVGLLAGIMICILLFYFDKKIYEAHCPTCNEKDIITHLKIDTVYIDVSQKKKKQQIEIFMQEVFTENNIHKEQTETDDATYDSEFSFEGKEQDDIFTDQLLQTKTIRVKSLTNEKQEIQLPDSFFQYFEIQQWSTPIKNKITYYRDQNMVKIKGIEIDKVNIVFWNDTYFLEIGNRYYTIFETQNFEKLIPVQIP